MSLIEPALLQQLPLFMAATLLLNATPGVDLLLTVTRTAQGGARAGAMAALGIAAGCAVHALAAAFGLAALLAWSATAFTLIKWAGAAYLAWLGVGLLRDAWRGGVRGAAVPRAPQASASADFRRGLLTNLLNPKVALFMLAFLPQFVPAQLAHKTPALLLLGALFVLQGLVFLLAVVLLTARLARLPALAVSARWLQAAGGLLFFALAARLAGSRLSSTG
ncbi:MAG TPA: LysE family translocator [Rubrivivax sp.]|nr:LysE family translocator [Rubrivivax sp.]